MLPLLHFFVMCLLCSQQDLIQGIRLFIMQFWVVYDSSYSIGVVDDTFQFRGKDNKLIGEPGGDSQLEGIAYNPAEDVFYLLHEVNPETSESEPYKPSITTVKIKKDLSTYDVVHQCDVDFELTHENKGFESIAYITTKTGENFLLGLCEGNYCVGGAKGREPGNGRIVVTRLKKANDASESCMWEVVKVVNVPQSAYFTDCELIFSR